MAGITHAAAAVASPVRAAILQALLSGMALTAKELSVEANVEPSTAINHLKALEDAQLIKRLEQGRRHYFTLASDNSAELLEALLLVGCGPKELKKKPGPGRAEEELRHGRVCYNHMAGRLGVDIYQSMRRQGFLSLEKEELGLTPAGVGFLEGLGVDLSDLESQKRPLCRPCLDWSERRYHLAGPVAILILQLFLKNKWVVKGVHRRALKLTTGGRQGVEEYFGG